MLGLVSNSSGTLPVDVLKAALPIGLGLASAAFLTLKLSHSSNGFSSDKSIPTVPLRPGDTTHDAEYREGPDLFLSRCEQEFGPVFNCYIQGQSVTAVSGRLVREVFLNDNFSFSDAIDDMTGIRAFTQSVVKSNGDPDNTLAHEMIRDNISPNLPLFTPRIVDLLESILDNKLGYCEAKLVKNPLLIIQEMVASAMANVFMGPEVAKDPKVIETFSQCTYDFAKILEGTRTKASWNAFFNRRKYGNKMLNPMHHHVQVLVTAAAPVILERRRQEAEALAKHEAGDTMAHYERPLDVLQKFLDNFDKYHFVDLEDVCGHILMLVLASVHTTSDTSTNLCYYLAAFPECMEPLLEEQNEVLDQMTQEREKLRQDQMDKDEVQSMDDFKGTDLDPAKDREFSAQALKKMVKMDSFVREIFRYRTERLSLVHTARKRVMLSNGMYISEGAKVIINNHSVHQNMEMQGEDVSDFRPWRFVGKTKNATKAATDYLPFGMGKHACPGRFLAIQQLKTVGSLMISKYSKIDVQDKSKAKAVLLSRLGDPLATGLIFTSRGSNAKTSKE
ncbi:hypothetical protein EMPS_07917 [Entomortierella parvispora]|uniref:Cytochrome P450 n=1 Tax=Entomortierella parvispora TaxID=205924 RepID=A0A9P3HF28_9FUNG|nr:hypothetical protein EMPS_07917 [Entomortierella parvispora]